MIKQSLHLTRFHLVCCDADSLVGMPRSLESKVKDQKHPLPPFLPTEAAANLNSIVSSTYRKATFSLTTSPVLTMAFHYDQNDMIRIGAARAAREEMNQPRFIDSFWDELSYVEVTAQSLAELDRRNNIRKNEDLALGIEPEEYTDAMELIDSGVSIERFARHGGPDMILAVQQHASQNLPPPIPGYVNRVWPRFQEANLHFKQHLNDHRVHPFSPGDGPVPAPSDMANLVQLVNGYPIQQNAPLNPAYEWQDGMVVNFQAFMAPRFDLFVNPRDDPDHLNRFFGQIMPVLDHPNLDLPKEILIRYSHVMRLTSRSVRAPVPDFVDGALRTDLHPRALQDHRLRALISVDGAARQRETELILPNFIFDEGPHSQHACYAGAFGARAIHAMECQRARLQAARSEGEDISSQPITTADIEVPSNTLAAAFSATLWQGVLCLYAHHVEEGEGAGAGLHVYMNRIGRYNMWNMYDPEGFRVGARAFANLRSFAQMVRDGAIDALNYEYEELGYGTVDAPMGSPD